MPAGAVCTQCNREAAYTAICQSGNHIAQSRQTLVNVLCFIKHGTLSTSFTHLQQPKCSKLLKISVYISESQYDGASFTSVPYAGYRLCMEPLENSDREINWIHTLKCVCVCVCVCVCIIYTVFSMQLLQTDICLVKLK